MPCMGPSKTWRADQLRPFISDLYKSIEKRVNKGRSNYSLLETSEEFVLKLHGFSSALEASRRGLGLSYDINREKYALFGFLVAKLPNEEVINFYPNGVETTSTRINPAFFNFSEAELAEWIIDLFFMFDCEDF
jgi:hypothetical protein